MNDYDDKLLHKNRFPKAATYDLEWILKNEMGPNALWLLEELMGHLALPEGSRVLDMGCGRALTSIYLAKEHRARVWANDLWVSPDDTWGNIVEAGQADRICPIHAEAHNLPYAAGFFDAIISIDAYSYFGTDDGYLGYITRFLRDGGRMGLVMPAILQDLEGEPPAHLLKTLKSGAVFWDHSECWTLHSLPWWKRHLTRSRLVDLELATEVADGWKLWRDWEHIRTQAGGGFSGFPSLAEAIEEDQGRYVGFVMMVMTKRPRPPEPFDHSLRIRL